MIQSESSHDRRPRVLVVDDDRPLLDWLSRGLEEQGCEVVAASEFAQARERLRQEQFDALVTDVRLGDFNGLQLAIVAHGATPSMRLIVISGFDDPVLRAESAQLGAAYLLKPVTADMVGKLVRGG